MRRFRSRRRSRSSHICWTQAPISTIATIAGRTALMIAAEGGHAEIADLLLARGADPSLKDKAGKRAADLTVLSSLREKLTPH